jgi:hypothetical protein
MKVSLVTLTWLAGETGVSLSSRTFDVLRMRYVEGLGFPEIARTLEIRDLTARKCASRWKRRVHLREQEMAAQVEDAGLNAADEARWLELAAALNRGECRDLKAVAHARSTRAALAVKAMEEEDDRQDGHASPFQQAVELLAVIAGHKPAKPATPTYDEQGRKVGGGSQAVIVEELAAYIEQADAERGGPRPWHQIPENWVAGPLAGVGGEKRKPEFGWIGVTRRIGG